MNPVTTPTATAGMTFDIKRLPDGTAVPYQNGIPVPSFDPQCRPRIDLSGVWKKRRFDADHGFSLAERNEAWHERLILTEGAAMAPDFDDAAWEPKRLPLPENELRGLAQAHSSETYENGVWYRRTFTVRPEDEGRSFTLHALSVSYICDVWVNGFWVGMHEGGFTPFAFDLTPYIRHGDTNCIAIRVDNPPWGSRNDVIPAMPGTDFFNYTGIIHDVYVEVASPVHIARADLVPVDTEGRLRVKVVLDSRFSREARFILRGQVFEADRGTEAFMRSPRAADIKGAVVLPVAVSHVVEIAGKGAAAVEFEMVLPEPKLWSVYEPNLYVLELALSSFGEDEAERNEEDSYAVQFGVRTTGTDRCHILLNGQPVFLAGIARHEEWPGTGRTASWDRIWTDMLHIRSQGANFVRTGHYPNHVYTGIVLDRLGLLTQSEIPLWQLEEEHFIAQQNRRLADQMWREMIFSQYNRPSVIMWSTQNESNAELLRKAYNERVVADLRSYYDDGRLTTQSAAADRPGPSDASMEPLDVAGWTMYFGIFHGSTYYEGTKAFLEQAHAAYPDKPIVNTEFGHWSGDGDAFAESQLETYRDTYRALIERAVITPDGQGPSGSGYVAGIDFWIMYDWYVNHNHWIDTFGIFHMDRNTGKPVGELLREDYSRLTSRRGLYGG